MLLNSITLFRILSLSSLSISKYNTPYQRRHIDWSYLITRTTINIIIIRSNTNTIALAATPVMTTTGKKCQNQYY